MAQNYTSQWCSMERNDNFYQIVYTKFEKQLYHDDCYIKRKNSSLSQETQVRSEYK